MNIHADFIKFINTQPRAKVYLIRQEKMERLKKNIPCMEKIRLSAQIEICDNYIGWRK